MSNSTTAKSITKFCKTYDISESFFYKLRKQGKAPKILKLGKRSIITPDAEQEWREEMEANA